MEPVRTLIVDDDPAIRTALVRLLNRDPRVRAAEAKDGLHALQILESEPFELVISDEVMPRVNGVRLLETIRARWPGTRRILFTGHPNADVVMEAVNRGGLDKALSKGMAMEQLQHELGEVIERCIDERLGRGTSAPTALLAGVAAGDLGFEELGSAGPFSVLVAADELALRSSITETLKAAGYTVSVTSVSGAANAIAEQASEVVVLDLSDGAADVADLMRRLRGIDLDCVVIATAPRSALREAQRAMSYGAFRYLIHPVSRDGLVRVVHHAGKLRRLADLRRNAQGEAERDAAWQISDRAALEVRFQRALEKLFMVYQPIVSWSERRILGYEALVRSEEPTMTHPGALFDAASRLDRIAEIGRAVRALAPPPVFDCRHGEWLFLNVHLEDLSSLEEMQEDLEKIASRTVLEVTERAALDSLHSALSSLAALRARGFQIAVDDIGAGYAGLSSFATLEPEVVKLDMSLVRNVDQAPVKQRLVTGLSEMCRDLGVKLVAEGVETVAERDTLIASGCDLFQGFLFARPQRPFPEVSWS